MPFKVREIREGCSDCYAEYDDLSLAKLHIDSFYKQSSAPTDNCVLTQITEETIINYISPFQDGNFKRLMGMEKNSIVKEYLEYMQRN